MSIQTIRAFASINQAYLIYSKSCGLTYNRKHASVDSNGARLHPTLPTYTHPTSLLGRLAVALSGSAARRERACARANTFVLESACDANYAASFSNTGAPIPVTDKESQSTQAAFELIALRKFMYVYKQSTKVQQEDMLGKLTPEARSKFEKYADADQVAARRRVNQLTTQLAELGFFWVDGTPGRC